MTTTVQSVISEITPIADVPAIDGLLPVAAFRFDDGEQTGNYVLLGDHQIDVRDLPALDDALARVRALLT